MPEPLRLEVSLEMAARELPLPAARLRRDAWAAISAAGLTGAVSLAVVGDATMRRVNRQFHSCDEPTDVLAFAFDRPGPGGVDFEIVVSLDTARREARAHRVEPAAELMLYVVHGALHLAGHDDHALADARRMHVRALSILDGLGHRNTIVARAKTRPRGRRPRPTT